MVVGIHTQPFGDRLNDGLLATTIFRIAVPFFFCVSSYLFFRKENKNIYKSVKRLLILDVAWTILQAPYIFYKFIIISDKDILTSILNLIQSMLIGESYMGSWYIHASWLGLLILYYMTKNMKEVYVILCSSLLFGLALIDTSYKFVLYNSDNHLFRGWLDVDKIIMPSESFLIAIPYMAIGWFLAKRQLTTRLESLKSSSLWFLIIGMCMMCLLEASICRTLYETYLGVDENPRFECFVTIVPIVFLLLIVLQRTKISISDKVCKYMRIMSILIYLSHQILMLVLFKITGLSIGITFYCITVIASIMLSIFIIWTSNYIKILKFLY